MKLIPLNTICDISIGKTPARKEKKYWGNGYSWLSIADMNNGKFLSETKEQITHEAIKECNMKLIPEGTLVMSFKLSLGKVGITSKDLYSNEAIAAFKIKKTDTVSREYLYHALRNINLKVDGVRAVKGLTLNKAKLKNLQIPLPPLSTQKKIADLLDTADALRQKTQAIIDHYDQLAQSLFLEMFGDPVKNPMGWEITNIGQACHFVKDGPHKSLQYVK